MVKVLFDDEEFTRWLKQASHTLNSAQRDAEAGDYAWACFKAQQAAEFGIKALLRGFGLSAVGHSILALLRQAGREGLAFPQNWKGGLGSWIAITFPRAIQMPIRAVALSSFMMRRQHRKL